MLEILKRPWRSTKRRGRTILEEQIARLWAEWHAWYTRRYFGIEKPPDDIRKTYVELAKKARKREFPEFLAGIEQQFGFLPDKDFVDDLALSTQVVIKRSELLYAHGYLLYTALRRYLSDHPELESLTILESGTARGFSAVMMAKALADAGRCGRILTIDPLPAEKPIYWNCIHDIEGKKTRFELLEPWRDLVERYIIFIQGFSFIVLQQLSLARIHFAFLDGAHTYKDLSQELQFVASHQQTGDILITDDYTPRQFPELVRAVDNFIGQEDYAIRVFQVDTERGYAYLARKAGY